MFKDRLQSVCHFKFVASARIQNPLASKTHFHLVYGTRNVKGLIEFRGVEKQAMRLQEQCRHDAQSNARQERTGQIGLFSAFEIEGLIDPDPRKVDRNLARDWIESAVQAGHVRYETALVEVLQRYSVTQPELGDILVELQKAGIVTLLGMGNGKRKPHSGVSIVSAKQAA